jgi:uncharacterized protein (TIGR03435 family)
MLLRWIGSVAARSAALAAALAIAQMASLQGLAQTPVAEAPVFDVASVRVNTAGLSGCLECAVMRFSHGGFTVENGSLLTLISQAYGVRDSEISGPGWLGSNRYDIAAKTADSAPDDQIKLMLRSLLADRFNLKLHREEKELPTYLLSVASHGPKLPHGTGSSAGYRLDDGALTFHNLALKDFAERLPRFFKELGNRPVLDHTGLDGTYDFLLKLADSNADAVTAMAKGDPSIFTIVREQLGLELRVEKLPTSIVVVDRVEKVPSAN